MLAQLLITLVLQSQPAEMSAPVSTGATSPQPANSLESQTPSWFSPTLLGKARLQAFEKDPLLPENTTGFRVTLLELGAAGTLSEHWSYRVKINAAVEVIPLDFYADYKPLPQVSLRFGQFKAPFGKEELSSTGALVLPDRALVAGLAPSRDIGVMAFGDEGPLGYAAGVFNGEGRNLARNINNAFPSVGRVTLTPWGDRVDGAESLSPRRRGLTLGVNAGLNYHGDLQSAKEVLAGTDVSYYVGRFGLMAEWDLAKFAPPGFAKVPPYQRSGFYVQPAFLIGRRWEWALRYERFEPNSALTTVQNQSIEGITLGTSVYFDAGRELLTIAYGKFAEREGPLLNNNTLIAQLQLRME